MGTIVIATTTLYGGLDEVKAKLALATINQARKHGYQIVVVDESPEPVRNFFQESGAIVFSAEKPGMGTSRRQAFREATRLAGSDGIIVWMEPEKAPLVPFLKKVVGQLQAQSADLVIPRRKSLKSYPLVQQRFEWLNNYAFQIFTGKDLDHCVGVRVFKSDITPFFLNYQGEYGDQWECLIIPVLRIIKAGKKVIEVEVDYVHPKEQTMEEEKEGLPMFRKRLEQLLNTVNSIEKESKILELF